MAHISYNKNNLISIHLQITHHYLILTLDSLWQKELLGRTMNVTWNAGPLENEQVSETSLWLEHTEYFVLYNVEGADNKFPQKS